MNDNKNKNEKFINYAKTILGDRLITDENEAKQRRQTRKDKGYITVSHDSPERIDLLTYPSKPKKR